MIRFRSVAFCRVLADEGRYPRRECSRADREGPAGTSMRRRGSRLPARSPQRGGTTPTVECCLVWAPTNPRATRSWVIRKQADLTGAAHGVRTLSFPGDSTGGRRGDSEVTDRCEGFDYIQRWYANLCDADWEHQYGISLTTIDNPGWSLRIDLDGTPWRCADFRETSFNFPPPIDEVLGREFDRTADLGPWYRAFIEPHEHVARCWTAYCDRESLSTIVGLFAQWAETAVLVPRYEDNLSASAHRGLSVPLRPDSVREVGAMSHL